MDFPVLNTTLLGRIVTWAFADHEADQTLLSKFGKGWGSWNQGSWFETKGESVCGSTACIAGQAVSQIGFGMVLEPQDSEWNDTLGERVVTGWRASFCAPRQFTGLDEQGHPVYETTGESESISTVAARALGLTSYEADALFSGTNDIGSVVGFSLLFAAVRGVDLGLRDDVAEVGREWLAERNENYADVSSLFWSNDTRGYTEAAVTAGLWNAPECPTCGQTLP